MIFFIINLLIFVFNYLCAKGIIGVFSGGYIKSIWFWILLVVQFGLVSYHWQALFGYTYKQDTGYRLGDTIISEEKHERGQFSWKSLILLAVNIIAVIILIQSCITGPAKTKARVSPTQQTQTTQQTQATPAQTEVQAAPKQQAQPAATTSVQASTLSFPRVGKWLMTGRDSKDWSNSIFVIEEVNNDSFKGYFEWVSGQTKHGREYFNGTYNASNNRITLKGYSLSSDAQGIALGEYEANITSNGRNIEKGNWGGDSRWEAKWLE